MLFVSFATTRQYLEYEGIGIGSPSKRQKQYQYYRVQRASEKVIDHKTQQFGGQETSIAEPEKRAIKRSKYSKVIDRLVEDLIQEAMSKGEFKNLAGSGKPLKLEQEYYVGKYYVGKYYFVSTMLVSTESVPSDY